MVLNELVVSLYILGVLAAGIVLLKLVVDRVVERVTAHPLQLRDEFGYELAKWVVVIPAIAFAFVVVLSLFLFLNMV